MSDKVYDAVIVGAGMSGLAAGVRLAQYERNVCILEKHSMIGGLNMFDIPKLFNLGMPGNATLTTSLFIYNQAFSGSYFYNRAAAASMIMFVIIAFLSVGVFLLMRDKNETREKEAARKLARQIKRGELNKEEATK